MRAKFVRSLKETNTDIRSFYFLPEKQLKFTAGQYVELSTAGSLRHWFTISSCPGLREMSITTRLTGSEYKNRLNKLVKGDEVNISEPMGDFVLPIDSKRDVLMVAAGIGITPMLSILKDLTALNVKRQINLIYGAKTKADFIDLKPYMRNVAVYEEILGQISAKDILKLEKGLSEPLIYISGPEKMVEELVAGLKERGIDANRLVGDYFPGYERS